MNKKICIYHSRDLDGWMSAAIVKKWFIQEYKEKELLIYEMVNGKLDYAGTHIDNESADILEMLGWDYGDLIPDMTEYSNVIMVDISFPGDIMEALHNDDKLIWMDHHSSAINTSNSNNFSYNKSKGIRSIDLAACELTWMHYYPSFNSFHILDGMPELVRLLGRYDCFGHKGTNESVKVMEYQYGARVILKNYQDCYQMLETNPKLVQDFIAIPGYHIFKYVCSEAGETYNRSFPITFNTIEQIVIGSNDLTQPKSKLHLYKFLAVNQERFNPINFGIDYHEDGYDGFSCFWYNKGKWNWSLYNDNGEIDCSEIAKQFGGGGHPGASGFVLNDKEHSLLIKLNTNDG